MTEPGIGSDLAGMSATAIRDGDHYVLNGSKTFITNGINADLVIVAAKTDPRERHRGISLLVAERGMEGFERGRKLHKLGQHAQDTAELSFEDVRVPAENLLGQEGEGFIHLVSNLPQERLSIAASAVAAAEAALELDARLRARAPGLRPADRLVPELPLHARPAAQRSPGRAHLHRPLRGGARRRRAAAPRTPPARSGGAPSSRAASSTPACSSTAATATCSSTRSRGPTPTPA